MYTKEALQDLHARVHRGLAKLMKHCRDLSPDDLNREMEGFGYPTIRLQLHHLIGAEEYWIGVLNGVLHAADDDPAYPTLDSLVAYRQRVFEATERYLSGASAAELNTRRRMLTWGNKERELVPAHVVLRTQTHIYHHQGQIIAMSRILGRPAGGMDFPID